MTLFAIIYYMCFDFFSYFCGGIQFGGGDFMLRLVSAAFTNKRNKT
jgi:hypothetical protein